MMNKEVSGEIPSADRSTGERTQNPLTPDELAHLSDPDKQEHFRREYLAQLRQRACPGCGETDDPLI